MCAKVVTIFKMVRWILIRKKDFQAKDDNVIFVHPNWTYLQMFSLEISFFFMKLYRNSDITFNVVNAIHFKMKTELSWGALTREHPETLQYRIVAKMKWTSLTLTRWSSHRWQFEEFGCGDRGKAGFSANWTPTSVKLVTSSTATVQRGLRHTVVKK